MAKSRSGCKSARNALFMRGKKKSPGFTGACMLEPIIRLELMTY